MKGKFKKERFLCFTDTETSGLDPERHEILEIAAIRMKQPTPESGEIVMPEEVSRMHQYVLPTKPVDPQVAKLNGYSPEKWAENKAVPIEVALQEYVPILNDSRMAGQNPLFDFGFIMAALKRLNWTWPWKCGYHLLDVASMAWPLVAMHKTPGVNQESLVELLGLGTQTHTAISDVEQCVEVYKKLLQMFQWPEEPAPPTQRNDGQEDKNG